MFSKLIVIIGLLLLPATLFSISITGTQGYGAFGMDSKHTFALASILSAGIRFNEYFEIKYMSVDTSLRMPVLPFRIKDVQYSPSVDPSGRTRYLFFDSDIIGVDFTIPVPDVFFVLSVFYGVGRGKLYDTTVDTPSNTAQITMRRGFIQVLNPAIKTSFNLTESLIMSPALGVIFFYLNSELQYRNAYTFYASLSVFYEL